MGPVILRPGEGERLEMGASHVLVKAGSEQTAGTLYIGESTLDPGFPGRPPHIHEKLHDMFYVLEGTLTLRVGDETITAEAGTFACIPPGTVHTFSNTSDDPVRILNFKTPGGWENYMRALGEAAKSGMPPTPEEIGKIASRFDFKPA
jgi:quercetin dioxygenase-like cupin family protein